MFKITPFYKKRGELSRAVEDFFNGENWPDISKFLTPTFKVDVKEEDKVYKIVAELPGVDKKDIKITLEEGNLTIGVKHVEGIEEDTTGYIHRERYDYECERSVYLEDAESDNLKAKLEDGLLVVEIPKKPEVIAKKKTINID